MIETTVLEILIKHNMASAEQIRDFLQQNQGKIFGERLDRFLSYYLVRAGDTPVPELAKQGEEEVERLAERLKGATSLRVAVQLATSLLRFPPGLISAHFPMIVERIKDSGMFVNAQAFTDIFVALPSSQVRSQFTFYWPLFRELVSIYDSARSQFNARNLSVLLRELSTMGVRSPKLAYGILGDIARLFAYFRPGDLVRILESLAVMRIRQNDLASKVVEKVIASQNNRQALRGILPRAVRALFAVGADLGESSKDILEKAKESRMNARDVMDALIPFILTLNLPNELEVLEGLVAHLGKSPEKIKTAKLREMLSYSLMKKLYPNNPVLKEKVFTQEFIEKGSFLELIYKSKTRNISVVTEYLDALKIKWVYGNNSDEEIDFHLLIPDQKIGIYVIGSQGLNSDQTTLSGNQLLINRILSLKKDYKAVWVNFFEMIQIECHPKRARHLLSKGKPYKNKRKFEV